MEKVAIPKGLVLKVEKNDLIIFNSREELIVDINPFFVDTVSEKGFLLLSSHFMVGTSIRNYPRQFLADSSLLLTIKKKVEIALLGLSVGFVQQLDLVGVGFKAFSPQIGLLVLQLGFSHDVRILVPLGIELFCPKGVLLILKSPSKELLGSFISQVRNCKVPDRYKNKGLLRREDTLQKKKFKKR
jgi:large subunit ribosomal protein L6